MANQALERPRDKRDKQAEAFRNASVSRKGQPIMTVGQPGGRILPVGPGIGATQEECIVMSPTRAAGSPPIITVVEAIAIMPGPPGTQPGSRHGPVMSVIRAAGMPPIITVG
jgi:hypothetical protein